MIFFGKLIKRLLLDMGVPKKHTTKGSRNQRRMHLGLSKTQFGVCPNCGFYKSIERVNFLAKLEKKERKRREKEIKETEKDIERGKKGEKPLTMEELSRKKF